MSPESIKREFLVKVKLSLNFGILHLDHGYSEKFKQKKFVNVKMWPYLPNNQM